MLGNERVSHFASLAKYAMVGSAGQRNMMAVMMRWEDTQWHARDDRAYLLN